MAQAIYDDQPMTAPFHPLFFRVLLHGVDSVTPNLHELEAFDPREAQSCRQLLAMEDPFQSG